MRQLIVNADDFGLTPGVNRAIAEAHREGVISSTTLMAVAHEDTFREAVELAHAMPGLSVGCHVVLVDGRPVSPPGAVDTLLAIRSG
ncbi:MAG: ChbG/HpnK family deacetylase, partial [Terriglobales bacterium]